MELFPRHACEAWRQSSALLLLVVPQSKLHVMHHDKGFLQSNLKYLTELSSKLGQYAEDARAAAAARAVAHVAEATRRKQISSLRASLADSRAANEARSNKSIGFGHQITDLKVSSRDPTTPSG